MIFLHESTSEAILAVKSKKKQPAQAIRRLKLVLSFENGFESAFGA